MDVYKGNSVDVSFHNGVDVFSEAVMTEVKKPPKTANSLDYKSRLTNEINNN